MGSNVDWNLEVATYIHLACRFNALDIFGAMGLYYELDEYEHIYQSMQHIITLLFFFV